MSTFSDHDRNVLKPADSPTVKRLLEELTRDEKISLLHGAADWSDLEKPFDSGDPKRLGQAGYLPGVPRLSIPELRLSDGPAGVNVVRDATGMPVPISLAATFSPELATQYGTVLGREARTLGQDVLLAVQIDIARVPQFTRIKDMLGEDPYLTGEIGAAYVEGIQAQGVMAMAKHFIANNQARGQSDPQPGQCGPPAMDFQVDDRTLHEIYLVEFERVICSRVSSIMAGYNHINGSWNTENQATLVGLLRNELGFSGFVCSDWLATHSVSSIEKGLDLEMPDGSFFGERLKNAVANGEIQMSTVDQAVRRVLGQMEAFGLLGGRRPPAPPQIDILAGATTARKVATAGAVLLRNVDGVLPLRPADLNSLAVIGPTAAQLAAGLGGERSYGFPGRLISPLDALRYLAGESSNISYAVGVNSTGYAVPSTALSPAEGHGPGLSRETSDGGVTTVDPTVDFTGASALPPGKTYTWSGTITAPDTGDYDLKIQSWGGTGTLELAGEKVATSAVPVFGFVRPWTSLLPTTDGLDNGQAPTMQFKRGKAYSIRITGVADATTALQIRLAWVTPKQRQADVIQAVRLASTAHTAVVFAFDGIGGSTLGIAGDRTTLALPNQQDKLISAVAAANPNTVVVLNTGWPVTMPWLPQVRSVLQMWYPGQEGGWATADLLQGHVSPSGKLPVTFPAHDTDTPAGPTDKREHASHPERYWGVPDVDGVRDVVKYTEHLLVGYRWYDQQAIEPLFSFGHGLSYTSFDYSNLTVLPFGDGLEVCFTIRNSGTCLGAEVPQVYVGPPTTASLSMPPRALAGFQRIELAPDQKQRVTILVDARQLSYWSPDECSWVVATGERPVYVGSSSRDIKLTGTALIS